MGRHMQPIEPRFWPQVIKAGQDECWLWTGARWGLRQEYGNIMMEHKKVSAHVASWVIHNGPIPEGLEVCHTCDNGLCVNPAHLWLGTHQENMTDAVKKHRNILPPRSSFTKLDWNKVADIRRRFQEGESLLALSKEFHVTKTCLYYAVTYRTWKVS